MFNKSLSQIEYEDVKKFCNTFGEGVRVEYKSKMIDNIPKEISAFANTLGGIIIIGVEADKVHNKVSAVNGIDKEDGLEERLINSALMGIYPSVFPEVKILDIPTDPNKILVVIKVHESINAPHSIQNTTRTYIRTGSVSRPYELAEIGRIEYLLKRREQTIKIKDGLIERANSRFNQLLGGSAPKIPYVSIIITPTFPYQPIISLDDLFLFGNQRTLNSREYSLYDSQKIMGGIFKFYNFEDGFSYREINQYGIVFVAEALKKAESRWGTTQEKERKSFIYLSQIILNIAKTLILSKNFLNHCGYFGNLEIKVNVCNITGENLMFSDEGFADIYEYRAIDNFVSSSQACVAEDIQNKLPELIYFLLKDILWIFNCSVNPDVKINEILEVSGIQNREKCPV